MNGIRVRPARVDDAAEVVPLLVEAIDHLALQLAGAGDHAGAVPFFTRLFEACGNRYSHEHALVLESEGEIAAAILAYPGCDEEALVAPALTASRARDPFGTYQHEPESASDEFYLDALTVAPAHRGAGHAAALIEAVCMRAAAAGHARAGLLVDLDKPGVKRLYGKLGFVVDGERSLAGHRYEHMSRALAPCY
ncbi:GNAT family N-acetyltransferase [Dokdonella sp.]|uniref:GNAT family N-acetyltransferase n=1 Tax=Dokdonella sp. TaxID=2291710 RepID=UPI0026324E20|nr:GNAT family N-acetyltransferase [Dokdonella sp.]